MANKIQLVNKLSLLFVSFMLTWQAVSHMHSFTRRFASEVYQVLHACTSYGYLNCPSWITLNKYYCRLFRISSIIVTLIMRTCGSTVNVVIRLDGWGIGIWFQAMARYFSVTFGPLSSVQSPWRWMFSHSLNLNVLQ